MPRSSRTPVNPVSTKSGEVQPMLRDDYRVPVIGGEHLTRVKREAERRHVCAKLLHGRLRGRASPLRAELRIRYVALMAKGEAEVQAFLPGDVELIARHVVAEQ